MSTNHHTPFIDLTSKFRPSHMNAPLAELDAQITANVAQIAANAANIITTVRVLETVNVDFSVVGETALYSGVSGEFYIPIAAVVRVKSDAGATQVTIGRSGEVTDFLNTQTLSNLNSSDEMAILQPIPSATPVGLKTYEGLTELRMNVENADGGSVNWVDVLGYVI